MVVETVVAVNNNGSGSSSGVCKLLSDLLLDSFLGLVGCGGGLLGHTVSLDSLGIVLLAVGVNLVAAVLRNELCEVLDGPGTAVLDGVLLVAGTVKLDGGETLDLIGNIVCGSVNLCDSDEVGEAFEKRAELIVLGRKSLAVSAPWGIEFEKNVLGVVENDVVVVLGNNNGDGAILLGDGLALNARLNLASDEVVEELANLLFVDGTGEGELLVLLGVLDGEGRPLANL